MASLQLRGREQRGVKLVSSFEALRRSGLAGLNGLLWDAGVGAADRSKFAGGGFPLSAWARGVSRALFSSRRAM